MSPPAREPDRAGAVGQLLGDAPRRLGAPAGPEGHVVHPDLARRRSEPSRDVRPQARGVARGPRAVLDDRDVDAGRPHRRAAAEPGASARPRGDHSLDDLPARRAQPGKSLPADRLSAHAGTRLSELWRGHGSPEGRPGRAAPLRRASRLQPGRGGGLPPRRLPAVRRRGRPRAARVPGPRSRRLPGRHRAEDGEASRVPRSPGPVRPLGRVGAGGDPGPRVRTGLPPDHLTRSQAGLRPDRGEVAGAAIATAGRRSASLACWRVG